MATEPSPAGFVLGVDLGTSSVKVAAVGLDGAELGTAQAAYPTLTPHPGWSEQQPAAWLPAAAQAIRAAVAAAGVRPAAVRGLALAGAAHIGVLLDSAGAPLRPALLWNDQRTGAEAAALAREAGPRILALGRNWPSTTWTLPHLRWIAAHDPQSWRRRAGLLPSKDYLAWQLTGVRATDPASAVSLLLCDAARADWSDELLALADLPRSALPPILPIGARVGALTPQAAALTGLPAGTPLFNGTLDSLTETLAAGLRPGHDLLIRLATAGGIHRVGADLPPDRRLISYPYAFSDAGEGLWLQQAGTNACASAVAWARGLLAPSGAAEPDYAAWDAAAAAAPGGRDAPFFHPYLAGERAPCWSPALRGAFTGLTFRHGPADLARAVYEGCALSLRHALTAFLPGAVSPEISRPMHHVPGAAPDGRVMAVGGGARSDVWCTLVAAVLGARVEAAARADSALGAARIALSGGGLGGPPAAGEAARAVFTADEETARTEDERFIIYRKISEHLFEISKCAIQQVKSV